MAEVIQLTSRRSNRAASDVPEVAPATLFFDLASPYTYLVAERVDRRFGNARWRPAKPVQHTPMGDDVVATAQRRAQELRMPLVWPERFPARAPSAMRTATFAAEHGCGSAFAIAAGRLAFCGGFDIEEPEILAEAAAAAGLDVDGALAAARDPRRDHEIGIAGRELWHDGGTSLPVLRHEDRLYCGEPHITALLTQFGGSAARPNVS